ncbi:MAG: glutathione S-transferase [Henriciella sp.]|nr:glutathione S-transferase [Henriciella sp.]
MTTLYLGNLNYSSWSIRAALVARASGLEIEETVLPIGEQSTYDLLDEVTGQHRVPVLVTDDLVIHDSLAITEWISEQVAPGKVWPTDPTKRARARSLCAEMHASFFDLRSWMGVDIRSRKPTPDMTPGLRSDIERINQIWTTTRDSFGAGGAFLFGGWSAADAFFMPVATRFRTYGVALHGVSAEYAASVLQHPLTQQIEAQAEAEPWTQDPLNFQPK